MPGNHKAAFNTRAVHGGERRQGMDRPTSTPIYTSSTYAQESAEAMDAVFAGEREGYVYQRYGNPTNAALEAAIADLESGQAAVSFASGMAALHAALLACELQSGDVVLCSRDIYGASLGLLGQVLGPLGVDTRRADFTDLAELETALFEQPHPKVALFEPISNPILKVADVTAISALAHRAGALVIADSTFTSPWLFRPLEYGADMVIHSATKYLSGHGDATGGAVIVNDTKRAANLRLLSKLVCGILGPFEASMIHRGVKTLALRMERQCSNALRLAQFLTKLPQVAKVYYSGLPDHPQHALATIQFCNNAYGAMVAFEIAEGSRVRAFRFMNALKLALPVTTLGDVYTEVSYPPMSSHREWTAGQQKRAGITAGTIRVSVGIEHIDDICDDFKQALAASAE